MVMESRLAKSIRVEIGSGFGVPVPNIRVKIASLVTEAVTLTADVVRNLGIKGSVPLLEQTAGKICPPFTNL